jgi:hypothetical protein
VTPWPSSSPTSGPAGSRAGTSTQPAADWTRIQRAVERATRALDVHKTIKGNHTAAKKSIDEAVKWTDHLVTEIRAAIDILGQAVDDAQEPRAA